MADTQKRKSYMDSVTNRRDDENELLNELISTGLKAAKKKKFTETVDIDRTIPVLPIQFDDFSALGPSVATMPVDASAPPESLDIPRLQPDMPAQVSSSSAFFNIVSGDVRCSDEGDLEGRSEAFR